MAQNVQPVYEGKPIVWVASITAASTPRDGTATVTSLGAGGTDGTRIDTVTFISAQATAAANSAMVVRLFESVDTGANWFLRDEAVLPAVTASNTAIGSKVVFNYPSGLKLYGSAMKLGATKSVHAGVQDNIHVIVEGGDLTLV